MSQVGSQQWHLEQVRQFNNSRGTHAEIARVLQSVLMEVKRRTDPSAIVQVRPKSLASFSEKAIRKKNKYHSPIEQLTDVVGGRIITYTQSAANKVRRQIEDLDRKELLIDWDNTVNTADRLKPEEFGYKAMHYIVQLKPPSVVGVEVPSWLVHKVEIQVCTMMQHVWAAIGHDRIYKTTLMISDSLKRRLSAISALIETAQEEFESGIIVLDRYIELFPPELNATTQQDDEMKWRSVIDVEPHSSDARRRLAEHYVSLGRWQDAYNQLLECDDNLPTVLARRGRAAARLGKTQEAEELFLRAVDKDKGDWEARSDLGNLLTKKGDAKAALKQFREAFEIAAGEPRALVEYVTAMVAHEKNLSCTRALRGALDAAIRECNERAQLRVDLPNAYLQAGRCYLFRQGQDDVYSMLDAYCKACLTCKSIGAIEAERHDVAKILQSLRHPKLKHDLQPFECAEKLLRLLTVVVSRRMRKAVDQDGTNPPVGGLLDQKEESNRLKALATRKTRPSFRKRPVILVAGGCDASVEERIRTYRATMSEALKHFEGTVICGGTKAGISGVIGDIAQQRRKAIEAIGYLPLKLPKGDQRDEENYRIYEVCDDTGRYSANGPIQTWADLLVAGVEPAKVRLLGINGGRLSGFEFRLAMAMGATVGLVADSGRAVSTLLTDPDWKRLGRLTVLFNDAETIAAFIGIFCSSFSAIEESEERQKTIEALARAQHEKYQDGRQASKGYVHSSMLPWNGELDESYKESNRQQVAYLDRILRTENFAIVLSDDPRPAIDLSHPEYSPALSRMGQLEHGRFNAERLADGWQLGPERDLEKKTSPYLVPWDKLAANYKEWDYDPFRRLAKLLRPLKLKIVQVNSASRSAANGKRRTKRRRRK